VPFRKNFVLFTTGEAASACATDRRGRVFCGWPLTPRWLLC